MTAASKWNSHGETAPWGISRAELVKSKVRPKFYRKVTGHSTVEARRGTGPSTHTRIVEITSGITNYQQGLAATCKDPPTEGNQRRREGFGEAHEPV